MNSLFNLVLLVALVCLASSCQSKSDRGPATPPWMLPSQTGTSANAADYRLAVGDQIDVFVIEDTSFNGAYPIRNSGDIIIPKLGRVQVAGKTLPETEQIIKAALLASQLKTATVVVDPGSRSVEGSAQGIVVRLSGSVVKPGRTVMPLVGNRPVTAYQAISDGGGFAPFANKGKSYIIRVSERGTSRIPVNFLAIEEGKDQDVPLLDGDTIVVPQKVIGF